MKNVLKINVPKLNVFCYFGIIILAHIFFDTCAKNFGTNNLAYVPKNLAHFLAQCAK